VQERTGGSWGSTWGVVAVHLWGGGGGGGGKDAGSCKIRSRPKSHRNLLLRDIRSGGEKQVKVASITVRRGGAGIQVKR